MKKILAAFLVVAACFLLTGCGKVSIDTVVKKIDKKINEKANEIEKDNSKNNE